MPTFEPVPPDDPDVLRLVDAMLREMAERYDDEDPGTIARTDPAARWLAVRDDDGTVIGCGAVQPLRKSKPDAAPDHGEIKRVYLVPTARGRGLSRPLMDALISLARDNGYAYLQLETGTAQPEAVALYERSGWHRVPNYGQYVDDPRSICFGMSLVDRDGP